MAEHVVRVSQPTREVVNADYSFEIFSDGEKIGTLDISKGTVDWWPRNAKSGVEVRWEDFATLMDACFVDTPGMVSAARDISS